MPRFPNLAMRVDPDSTALEKPDPALQQRLDELDVKIKAELEAAGLEARHFDNLFRKSNGEVPTKYIGLFPEAEKIGWKFTRNWYYWVCDGPGLPCDDALRLHGSHGTVVRVAGHCGCPDPIEWYHGFGVGDYHVDSSEGLAALVATIRAVRARHADHKPVKAGTPK